MADLAILETGAPPAGLERFGSYPQMFERLLGPGAFDYARYDLQAGQWPRTPEAHRAYLITGSSSGVYETDAWIAGLRDFLRAVKGKAALVGVCYGHQAMADAFGGKVVKSDKGWGVGLQTYEVLVGEAWIAEGPSPAPIRVAASHQDQVVSLPTGARVLGGNSHAPFGMLVYDDQPAFSIQLHPEFDPAYSKALLSSRRGSRLAAEVADTALASLELPNDNQRVGGWIRRFINTHR